MCCMSNGFSVIRLAGLVEMQSGSGDRCGVGGDMCELYYQSLCSTLSSSAPELSGQWQEVRRRRQEGKAGLWQRHENVSLLVYILVYILLPGVFCVWLWTNVLNPMISPSNDTGTSHLMVVALPLAP